MVTWLLLAAVCCSWISPGFSGPEIWRSGVMAMTACEQWEEFNKTGKIPEPIKSTGNRKLCGWFKKGLEGDACADIRHFWLGCHIENTSTRIIGGSKVRKRGYPSALHFEPNFCGGSILSEEWALTAAHCIMDINSSYSLVAGDKVEDDDSSTAQQVETQKFFFPPKYNASDESDYTNDIALMKFTPKLKFNEHVQPVRLPYETDFYGERSIGVSVGWGVGSEGYLLNAVELAVITVKKCQESFEPLNIVVTDLIVCGQYPSGDIRNACYGDSGSPFYVCENNKLLQIGVANFIRSCKSHYPVGYARVSKFVKWIDDTMANN